MSNSGRFHCGDHNFRTDKKSDWDEHQKLEIHTHNGTAPCNYCGALTQFSYTGKIERSMPPALCNNCNNLIQQTMNQM